MTGSNKDFFKVTIDSKNFQNFNPTTGNFEPTMNAANLSKAENLLKTFERAIQSATNTFEGFQASLKKIAVKNDVTDPKNPIYAGRYQQSFYVQAKELENVMKALKAQNALLQGSGKLQKSVGDLGYDISAKPAREVTRFKTLLTREAVNLAKEGLSEINGKLVHAPTKKNPDRYQVSVLMGDETYKTITADKTGSAETSAITKYINEHLKNATKASSLEASRRKEVEAERQRQKEEKERSKELNSRNRVLVKLTQALLAGVTLTTVLLRKLGTKAINNAVETVTNTVTGTGLNLTASEVRKYNAFDVAHGRASGSTISAISAVQQSFGNIFDMDKATLDKLAKYIGKDVESLVLLGVGQSNPAELTKMIIDKFFSLYLVNQGSKTQLIRGLKGAMEPLGSFLENMIAEFENGIYAGTFKNVDEYLETTGAMADIKQKSEFEENVQLNVGQAWKNALSDIKLQLDNALTDFLASLSKFIDGIADSALGLEDYEKADKDILARKKNKERIESMTTNMELLNRAYLTDTNMLLGTHYGSLEEVDIKKYDKRLLSKPETYKAILMYQSYLNGVKELNEENMKISGVQMRSLEFSDEMIQYDAAIEINRKMKNFTESLASLGTDPKKAGGYSSYTEAAQNMTIQSLLDSGIDFSFLGKHFKSMLETSDAKTYNNALLYALTNRYNLAATETGDSPINTTPKGWTVTFKNGQKKKLINFLDEAENSVYQDAIIRTARSSNEFATLQLAPLLSSEVSRSVFDTDTDILDKAVRTSNNEMNKQLFDEAKSITTKYVNAIPKVPSEGLYKNKYFIEAAKAYNKMIESRGSGNKVNFSNGYVKADSYAAAFINFLSGSGDFEGLDYYNFIQALDTTGINTLKLIMPNGNTESMGDILKNFYGKAKSKDVSFLSMPEDNGFNNLLRNTLIDSNIDIATAGKVTNNQDAGIEHTLKVQFSNVNGDLIAQKEIRLSKADSGFADTVAIDLMNLSLS